MSISLAIDTATSRTGVAIINGQEIIWQGSHDGATAHGGALSTLGIAFARSFALARQISIIGICSLDAIAPLVVQGNTLIKDREDFIVATDARRKEIYWARYSNGIRVGEPGVNLPAVIVSLGLPIFGEGAIKYGLSKNTNTQYPDLLSLVALSQNPRAHVSEPMYLRRPDAQPTSERTP
ncbi:MAG: tRNA threonylcarbamoyladenosine biosynthesis protein TsaB [Actinobacteria bacterium]|nr:tRNA threonylcarbamoyladenosine biosynthesis protein TsaB [Actinomycetota bacterium]